MQENQQSTFFMMFLLVVKEITQTVLKENHRPLRAELFPIILFPDRNINKTITWEKHERLSVYLKLTIRRKMTHILKIKIGSMADETVEIQDLHSPIKYRTRCV